MSPISLRSVLISCEPGIISSSKGVCYATTSDIIPKTIKNCDLESGTFVTIKYGEGLAWATIVEP
ncbi:MAG: hypothetical protein IH949_06130 [Bacteroidetes bacterium]|nr:hypothetical protein [Bacteroidota bacterium]